MTSQQDIFVFIDEDQRKKYSKSTLSAINAQVAKYAHKRRQVAPPKPRVARKSPPQSHESDHSEPHAQDAEAKRCSEASTTVHPESRHKSAAFVPVNGKQDVKKKPGARDRARQDLSGKVKSGGQPTGSTELVYAKQEDLDNLFERVCRITHTPNYQGFPLHLNPEERQLTHYCECLACFDLAKLCGLTSIQGLQKSYRMTLACQGLNSRTLFSRVSSNTLSPTRSHSVG